MTLPSAPSQATSLAPLDTLILSPALDGRDGDNRADAGKRQIAADNDIDAIQAWLVRYDDNKITLDNYRKEAERLLLWATCQQGKPVSSLTHQDLLSYQRFLADPQPASFWIMRDGRKFGRSDPQWRPFAGPLSASSQRQAMVILNGLFAWLVHAGYLCGNPLSLGRQRRRQVPARVTRYLDEDLWQEVKWTIDAMSKDSARESLRYYRLRWLFSLLYLCGLRISEVVENRMGGFFCRRDAQGEDCWWLEISGKGQKLRLIPANEELMVELARYRREVGLSPYPNPGEDQPLLLPLGGKAKAMTRGAVHAIVKQVFSDTAMRLRQRGPAWQAQADRVMLASAHWLRHTAGSHMANQDVDLRHVRDNLGHESIATTSHYLHSSDDRRHQDTRQKHRIKW